MRLPRCTETNKWFKCTFTFVLAVGLLSGSCETTGRAEVTTTTNLWDQLQIKVPDTVGTGELRHILAPESYVFVASDGHVALIIDYSSSFMAGGGNPFSSHDLAARRPILLNGMLTWRKINGPYILMDVKLPRPKGCTVQGYAFLAFARGDQQASTMASTLKPVSPFPCITARP